MKCIGTLKNWAAVAEVVDCDEVFASVTHEVLANAKSRQEANALR